MDTQYETEEEVKEVNIYLGIQGEVLLGVAKDMVMSGFVRPCVGGGGGSSPKLVGNLFNNNCFTISLWNPI